MWGIRTGGRRMRGWAAPSADWQRMRGLAASTPAKCGVGFFAIMSRRGHAELTRQSYYTL